jgi:hypothetical protein
MSIVRSRVGAVAVGAALVVGLGSATAVAGDLIRSGDIKDETIRSVDIKNGTIRQHDLAPRALDALKGEQGPAGEQGEQGPAGKDGVSNLIVGAAYTDVWAPNSYGESIEECPEGQYAIGGGYSTWGGFDGTHDGYDLGGMNRDIQVTVSAPYFKGDYVPVDDAGNFRADQWVVRGYNSGDTEQIVRAWVVCADVTD